MTYGVREVYEKINTAEKVKEYAKEFNESFVPYAGVKFDNTILYEHLVSLLHTCPRWYAMIRATYQKEEETMKRLVNMQTNEQRNEMIEQVEKCFREKRALLMIKLNVMLKQFNLCTVLGNNRGLMIFMESAEGKKHLELYNILCTFGDVMLEFLRVIDYLLQSTRK